MIARWTATSIPNREKHISTYCGKRKLRNTTVGWTLLLKWKDINKSRIHLKYLKGSHLVEVAEYAKSCDIVGEAAYTW